MDYDFNIDDEILDGDSLLDDYSDNREEKSMEEEVVVLNQEQNFIDDDSRESSSFSSEKAYDEEQNVLNAVDNKVSESDFSDNDDNFKRENRENIIGDAVSDENEIDSYEKPPYSRAAIQGAISESVRHSLQNDSPEASLEVNAKETDKDEPNSDFNKDMDEEYSNNSGEGDNNEIGEFPEKLESSIETETEKAEAEPGETVDMSGNTVTQNRENDENERNVFSGDFVDFEENNVKSSLSDENKENEPEEDMNLRQAPDDTELYGLENDNAAITTGDSQTSVEDAVFSGLQEEKQEQAPVSNRISVVENDSTEDTRNIPIYMLDESLPPKFFNTLGFADEVDIPRNDKEDKEKLAETNLLEEEAKNNVQNSLPEDELLNQQEIGEETIFLQAVPDVGFSSANDANEIIEENKDKANVSDEYENVEKTVIENRNDDDISQINEAGFISNEYYDSGVEIHLGENDNTDVIAEDIPNMMVETDARVIESDVERKTYEDKKTIPVENGMENSGLNAVNVVVSDNGNNGHEEGESVKPKTERTDFVDNKTTRKKSEPEKLVFDKKYGSLIISANVFDERNLESLLEKKNIKPENVRNLAIVRTNYEDFWRQLNEEGVSTREREKLYREAFDSDMKQAPQKAIVPSDFLLKFTGLRKLVLNSVDVEIDSSENNNFAELPIKELDCYNISSLPANMFNGNRTIETVNLFANRDIKIGDYCFYMTDIKNVNLHNSGLGTQNYRAEIGKMAFSQESEIKFDNDDELIMDKETIQRISERSRHNPANYSENERNLQFFSDTDEGRANAKQVIDSLKEAHEMRILSFINSVEERLGKDRIFEEVEIPESFENDDQNKEPKTLEEYKEKTNIRGHLSNDDISLNGLFRKSENMQLFETLLEDYNEGVKLEEKNDWRNHSFCDDKKLENTLVRWYEGRRCIVVNYKDKEDERRAYTFTSGFRAVMEDPAFREKLKDMLNDSYGIRHYSQFDVDQKKKGDYVKEEIRDLGTRLGFGSENTERGKNVLLSSDLRLNLGAGSFAGANLYTLNSRGVLSGPAKVLKERCDEELRKIFIITNKVIERINQIEKEDDNLGFLFSEKKEFVKKAEDIAKFCENCIGLNKNSLMETWFDLYVVNGKLNDFLRSAGEKAEKEGWGKPDTEIPSMCNLLFQDPEEKGRSLGLEAESVFGKSIIKTKELLWSETTFKDNFGFSVSDALALNNMLIIKKTLNESTEEALDIRKDILWKLGEKDIRQLETRDIAEYLKTLLAEIRKEKNADEKDRKINEFKKIWGEDEKRSDKRFAIGLNDIPKDYFYSSDILLKDEKIIDNLVSKENVLMRMSTSLSKISKNFSLYESSHIGTAALMGTGITGIYENRDKYYEIDMNSCARNFDVMGRKFLSKLDYFTISENEKKNCLDFFKDLEKTEDENGIDRKQVRDMLFNKLKKMNLDDNNSFKKNDRYEILVSNLNKHILVLETMAKSVYESFYQIGSGNNEDEKNLAEAVVKKIEFALKSVEGKEIIDEIYNDMKLHLHEFEKRKEFKEILKKLDSDIENFSNMSDQYFADLEFKRNFDDLSETAFLCLDSDFKIRKFAGEEGFKKYMDQISGVKKKLESEEEYLKNILGSKGNGEINPPGEYAKGADIRRYNNYKALKKKYDENCSKTVLSSLSAANNNLSNVDCNYMADKRAFAFNGKAMDLSDSHGNVKYVTDKELDNEVYFESAAKRCRLDTGKKKAEKFLCAISNLFPETNSIMVNCMGIMLDLVLMFVENVIKDKTLGYSNFRYMMIRNEYSGKLSKKGVFSFSDNELSKLMKSKSVMGSVFDRLCSDSVERAVLLKSLQTLRSAGEKPEELAKRGVDIVYHKDNDEKFMTLDFTNSDDKRFKDLHVVFDKSAMKYIRENILSNEPEKVKRFATVINENVNHMNSFISAQVQKIAKALEIEKTYNISKDSQKYNISNTRHSEFGENVRDR